MAQNLVIPGADNKVRFEFGGVDLTLATDLHLKFGAETYTLLLSPTIVTVEGATTLALDLNATAEVGRVFMTVKYIDAGTTLGIDITSQVLGNSEQIIVAVGSQLIIEDGSNVENANSFCTDAELNAWASLYGYSVAATEPERDSHQVQAFSKLNSYENKLTGCRLTATQTGIYPRNDSESKGYCLDNDKIPADIKVAQMMMAVNIKEGATTNSFVKGVEDANGGALASFEVSGVYKETYQSGATATVTSANSVNASFPAVDEIMKPYLESTARGNQLERR